MSMEFVSFGAGNMAQAIIKGLKNKSSDYSFHLYTPTHTRALDLAESVNGKAYREIRSIPEGNIYLIACKPQQFNDLAKEIKSTLPRDALVISIMAGIGIEKIQTNLDMRRVVRVMPNTPSQIGHGMSLVYGDKQFLRDIKLVKEIFEAVGEVYLLKEESQMDTITPYTGSGPAFLFELARIMEESLAQKGLPLEEARSLVKQTLLGSTLLLCNENASPLQLRESVTSKKGVTFEALNYLWENKIEELYDQAFKAAILRSLELAKS